MVMFIVNDVLFWYFGNETLVMLLVWQVLWIILIALWLILGNMEYIASALPPEIWYLRLRHLGWNCFCVCVCVSFLYAYISPSLQLHVLCQPAFFCLVCHCKTFCIFLKTYTWLLHLCWTLLDVKRTWNFHFASISFLHQEKKSANPLNCLGILNFTGIWNRCPSLRCWCCNSRSHGIIWSGNQWKGVSR